MDNEAHGPGELTDSKGCVSSFIWKKSYANGIGTLSFPGKAAYEIDEYQKDFSTARIPIRRQVILNEAIAHLVANVLPNLEIA